MIGSFIPLLLLEKYRDTDKTIKKVKTRSHGCCNYIF